jgi:hypothetical protein
MPDEPLTPEQVKEWEKKIDAMSHEDMARHWRFAKPGDVVFITPELYARFEARYKALGGMTPELSKKIGWGT